MAAEAALAEIQAKAHAAAVEKLIAMHRPHYETFRREAIQALSNERARGRRELSV